MPTAKILQVSVTEGVAVVQYEVTASDGTSKYVGTVSGTSLTPNAVRDTIRAQAKSFEATLGLSSLPVANIDISDPIVVAPTAEEVWRNDYAKWLKVKQLIDSGILTGAEVPVVALKGKVTTNLKPEYLANL